MSLFLVEHKTTSDDISPGSPWWRRVISIDPQVTIYLNGLQASGLDCRGVVYDALRKPAHRPSSKGETAEHYERRVCDAIAKDPERYYQRSGPVRLHEERSESGFDVWQTAAQIRESKRLGMWPRNPDSCLQWNRACDYLPVCTGEAEIDDPFLYRRSELLHEELGLPPGDVSIIPGNHDLYTRGAMRSQRFMKYFGDFMTSDLPELGVDIPLGRFPFVRLRGPAAESRLLQCASSAGSG